MNEFNKLIEEMTKGYSEYVNVNSDEIINDFCDKIKEHKIGDLDLNTYSCFRFWRNEVKEQLEEFFEDFKKETKDKEITFNEFCEFTWSQLGDMVDEIPEGIGSLMSTLKGVVAKA